MHAVIPCSTESMNPYRAVDSSIGFVNSRGELTAAVQHLGAASGGLDVLAPDRYRQRLSCARRTRESRRAFPAAFHAERVLSSHLIGDSPRSTQRVLAKIPIRLLQLFERVLAGSWRTAGQFFSAPVRIIREGNVRSGINAA